MKIYNKIKKQILHSLEDSYYVIINFMSNDLPLEITIHKESPKEYILFRIEDIILSYKKVFNKKIGKITVYRDGKSLTTRIFIEVKNG